MAEPWEILTVNERRAVGAFIREISEAKATYDRERLFRARERYLLYCEYLGEKKMQGARWVNALYSYGWDGHKRKLRPRKEKEEFEQLTL